MYREYINNPITEREFYNGKDVSTYFQNPDDRRYSMYITCCFEKSYNFWDRIGDRIASFFPELLKIREVDFVKIIDKLSGCKIESDNFNWLLEFRNSEYKKLNEFRRNMVHYYQFEANYRFQHGENNTDFEKLNILWKEKSEFTVYFKNQLELEVIGYFKMVDFLNEVIVQKIPCYLN
jgi:hypothetical protein